MMATIYSLAIYPDDRAFAIGIITHKVNLSEPLMRWIGVLWMVFSSLKSKERVEGLGWLEWKLAAIIRLKTFKLSLSGEFDGLARLKW